MTKSRRLRLARIALGLELPHCRDCLWCKRAPSLFLDWSDDGAVAWHRDVCSCPGIMEHYCYLERLEFPDGLKMCGRKGAYFVPWLTMPKYLWDGVLSVAFGGALALSSTAFAYALLMLHDALK